MEKDGRVKFHQLFKHADSTDLLLMLVGTVSAVANGASQPIMMIIFGEMITAFGGSTSETVLERVNKVALKFVYLGVGAGIVSFLQVSCWAATGERQATRIRTLFLKSVLRQDIAFFDLEMTTGQVISCASSDTVLIQGAIGEKVGKLTQLITTFLGGIAVAFMKGWLLTLVMISTVPLFIVAGAIVSRMLSQISGKGQKSYSDAGDIVEQTIGSIRTVVSFNGEKEAICRYNNQIKKAYKATVTEGATQGLGYGSLSFIYFSTFGLIIWYGTKLTLNRGYVGGDIISILFAIMVGGRALGDATHCLADFADGRTAAHRLFKTIQRKPEIDSDDAVAIILEDIKGDVELKDVYFSYPSRPEQSIFDGLSLYVSSGKTMALVGESGSGKSTVISLVERFYDPHAGEVCIDGINIKNFKLDWIRQKIGLIHSSTGHHNELVKDPDGAYSQLIRLQEANQEDGYQLDAGISLSRSTRSLSLQRSTSNPAGGVSRPIMTPIASLTVLKESTKQNGTNSERKNENNDGKIPKKAPIGRLLTLSKPETSVLVFGSIAAAIHGALIPMIGFLLATAAKILYEPLEKRGKDSIFWSLVCVGLGIISMVSRFANCFLFGIAGGKLIERIRALAFQSIVHQEIPWFDDSVNSSGALGGRLCIDALNLRRLVGDNLAITIQCTASLLSGIVIAMISDWKLSLVIMFVIPLIGLQGYAQVKFLKGFSQDAKMTYEEASQVAADAVVSIKTIASFCAQNRVVTVYNNKCQASRIQGIRTGIVGGLGFGFSNLMVYSSSALCYFIGAQFMSHGQSTFSSVLKAYLALVLAMIGLSEASALATNTKKAKDSAMSIFSIIDKKSKIDSSNGDGLTLDLVKGDIDFNHISFKYPCRPDVQIFADFTLNIPSGK
ncbi:hypothetical protein EJB05_36598, partial [Eragrostis curvula]